MMHVGLPSWFVTAQYPPLFHRAELVIGLKPLRRNHRIPILYVRENGALARTGKTYDPSPTFRSVECPVEVKNL